MFDLKFLSFCFFKIYFSNKFEELFCVFFYGWEPEWFISEFIVSYVRKFWLGSLCQLIQNIVFSWGVNLLLMKVFDFSNLFFFLTLIRFYSLESFKFQYFWAGRLINTYIGINFITFYFKISSLPIILNNFEEEKLPRKIYFLPNFPQIIF